MIGVSLDITEHWNIQTEDCTWTDEAYRIFGWAPQASKVTMERFLASIVEEDRPRVQAAIRAALVEGQPYRVEYDVALPDGSRRHIREEDEVTLDEHGNAATMIGASQDVTTQKMEEAARLRTAWTQNW
jgi:PAS domain S-box-containing protein